MILPINKINKILNLLWDKKKGYIGLYDHNNIHVKIKKELSKLFESLGLDNYLICEDPPDEIIYSPEYYLSYSIYTTASYSGDYHATIIECVYVNKKRGLKYYQVSIQEFLDITAKILFISTGRKYYLAWRKNKLIAMEEVDQL